ncbi:hypothetical protein FRC12_005762 [Ceratobasidium sp. 428]|nr:hypothetical protein FRC12_005762 [Ceratobasidium sp. 428]
MTLCELVTAERVSLPLECKSLTDQSPPSMVSQCVEALSRSAQHWSSYSGYLREIPQLCTAYRRLNEIDHAKSIYANITLEKAALFSSLDVYHSKLVVREEELEALTKALGSIAVSLGQHSSAIDDSLTRFPDQAKEMIAKIHEQAAILLNAISTSSQLANQNTLTNLEHHLRSIILEAQNSLSLTSKELNGDVSGLASSLDAVALSWNSRLVAFNKRLDLMWDETFVRKLALEAALEDLNIRVSEAAGRVDAQMASAERLQEITSETAVSIRSANSHIADVSSTLSREVESLKSVARELQSNLTQIPTLMPKPGLLTSVLPSLSSVISVLGAPGWHVQLAMQVIAVGASRIQHSLSLGLTFGCTLFFLASQTFYFLYRIIGALSRWCFKDRIPSNGETTRRSSTTTKRHVYRPSLAGRSRLSSALPHFETGSL